MATPGSGGSASMQNFLSQPLPQAGGKARDAQAQPKGGTAPKPTPSAPQAAPKSGAEGNPPPTMPGQPTGTQNALEGVQTAAQNAIGRAEGWAAGIATPGGIGIVLLAIIVLLWAVVPVNGGRTRMELLWLTLMGRTRMAASPDAGSSYTDLGTGGKYVHPSAGSNATGGGGNGYNSTATNDLLSSLSIRDFGSSSV